MEEHVSEALPWLCGKSERNSRYKSHPGNFFFWGGGEIGVVMLEIKKFIEKFLSLEEARITGV